MMEFAVDHADLVFDVGVHGGEDTAYYLHKGYRVIGIEANPILAAELQKKFTGFIASGQLELLNVGIATEDGEGEFWICDDVSEWSSFHREIASRGGARHHRISIPTTKFSRLLTRYARPHYIKVDIEGNDDLCVHSLTENNKPKYLSYEMPLDNGERDLNFLREIGYTRFKIVSQVTRTQPFAPTTMLAAHLPDNIRNKLHTVLRLCRGVDRDHEWKFEFGSSGGFGELTPGPWQDHGAAVQTWTFLHRLNKSRSLNGLGDWYDVHAAC
jgi:FkbM family methyltransferase